MGAEPGGSRRGSKYRMNRADNRIAGEGRTPASLMRIDAGKGLMSAIWLDPSR